MQAYETISPSAYALLMMKSHTSIPYAREAAALLAAQSIPGSPGTAPAPTQLPAGIPGLDVDPVDYWTRVMHFESRYWSINQLLTDLPSTNILEISSGFSFRGLDLSTKQPVYYIDTDLPNIITGKQHFIAALAAGGRPDSISHPAGAPRSAGPAGSAGRPTPGHYELAPLNALDPAAFDAIIAKFPPGPITIVNEGLLVYLDNEEKAQLCANIRKALITHGGRWITADVYIRRKESDQAKQDAWRQWSNEHLLEEKKFTSFLEAENFFHSMGFNIEKEATQDYSRLTSFSQFVKATGPEALDELRRPGRTRIHATWRLVPSP